MADHDYLTTADAAARIGVSRQTIDRWIRLKLLKATRIEVGARAVYRIRPADLADFVRRYVRDEW